MTRYRELDGRRVLETARVLERRIDERFPGANLRGVAAQLVASAEAALTRAPSLRRPHVALRGGVVALAILLVVVVVSVIVKLGLTFRVKTFTELVTTLESGVNDVVFVGIAIWFLGSLEGRLKRRQALGALHELRSLAHIVDMHQLTKDPDHVLRRVADTASSPARTMSRGELSRYLDYCSEILSLTGKVAALYAEHLQDSVVLGAVTEVESLATGISRKIWQKLALLNSVVPV